MSTANATTASLNTERGIIPLTEATLDELYSARAHGWSEYYSSLTLRNQFGQTLRSASRSSDGENDYRTRLIESRGIREIEAEIIRREADPKSKNFQRVSAGWNHFA